jgi:hypothetical protein
LDGRDDEAPCPRFRPLSSITIGERHTEALTTPIRMAFGHRGRRLVPVRDARHSVWKSLPKAVFHLPRGEGEGDGRVSVVMEGASFQRISDWGRKSGSNVLHSNFQKGDTG